MLQNPPVKSGRSSRFSTRQKLALLQQRRAGTGVIEAKRAVMLEIAITKHESIAKTPEEEFFEISLVKNFSTFTVAKSPPQAGFSLAMVRVGNHEAALSAAGDQSLRRSE